MKVSMLGFVIAKGERQMLKKGKHVDPHREGKAIQSLKNGVILSPACT